MQTSWKFRGRWGLAIGITILGFVFFVSIWRALGKYRTEAMQFPNFLQVPMSPILVQPGIKVSLGATAFKVNEKIPLYGSYLYDGEFYVKCRGDADTWIWVTAIARDIPRVSSAAAYAPPNLAPVAEAPPPLPDPSFREGGYFNLDLREHLHLPEQPSRYWLLVTMGDYKTDLIPFELK